MGKAVAYEQPTKFALMEGVANTTQNPLIAFLAYGNPQHAIVGFHSLRSQCDSLGHTFLANLADFYCPEHHFGFRLFGEPEVCLSIRLNQIRVTAATDPSIILLKILRFRILDLLVIDGLGCPELQLRSPVKVNVGVISTCFRRAQRSGVPAFTACCLGVDFA